MEKLVLASFLNDIEYNQTVLPHIKSEFFEDDAHKVLIDCAIEYSNEHKKLPPKIVIDTLLQAKLNIPQSIFESAQNILINVYSDTIKDEVKNATIEWKLDETLKWFKERAAFNTILISLEIIDGKHKENGKITDKSMIPELMQKALSISFDTSIGHDYIEDADGRFEFMHQKLNKIPFKIPLLNKITNGGIEKKSLNTFMGGTGCHAKGAEILLYNGLVKTVEDITTEDILVGDDGQPRYINHLIRNQGQMYKVTIRSTGEIFTVNEDHILSLYDNSKKIVNNISIKDYLLKSDKFKHTNKSYYVKSPINFAKTNLKIDPYFLGIYLGDGSTHNIGITNMDNEVIEYFLNYVQVNYPTSSVRVTKKDNTECKTYHVRDVAYESFSLYNKIAKDFSEYGLHFTNKDTRTTCSDKFIPNEYKTSCIEDRLQLLAGLLDTDGSKDICDNYEFTSKSKQLALDVMYLTRSLAMYCKMSEKIVNGVVYYRLYISQSESSPIIPMIVPRKQTLIKKDYTEKQYSNPLHSSFSIEKLDIQDYYGFSISGNNLYCMGNFMVTHNTGKSLVMCSLAADYISMGYDVLYITLEMAEEKISTRIDANLLNVELDQLKHIPKATYLRKFDAFKDAGFGKLIVKEYPTATAGASHFRFLMRELESKQGFLPDVVFIDYLGIAASSRYKSDNMYQMGKSVSEEFRGLAVERNVAMWTAVQSNRNSQANSDVEMTDISESFGINMVCDFIMAIISTEELKALGQLRFKQLKNRYEDMSTFTTFLLEVARSKMRVFQNDDYTRNNPPEIQHKKPESILPTKSKFDNLRSLK